MRSLPWPQPPGLAIPVQVCLRYNTKIPINTHPVQAPDPLILPCLGKTIYRARKTLVLIQHLRLQAHLLKVVILSDIRPRLLGTPWSNRTDAPETLMPFLQPTKGRPIQQNQMRQKWCPRGQKRPHTEPKAISLRARIVSLYSGAS